MKRLLSLMLLIVLVITALPAAAQEDMAQMHKAALISGLEAANTGDMEPLYALFADTLLLNGEESARAETVEAYQGALLTGIPDLQMTPELVIAQGDWVAIASRMTGTFTNTMNFFGQEIPANNAALNWTELSFSRFDENGQIVEHWALSDPAVMFSQMGMMEANGNGGTFGEALTDPAGYELLTPEELAATFTTGQEERNIAALEAMAAAFISGEATNMNYTDPYIDRTSGVVSARTHAQMLEDSGFITILTSAMPDATFSIDIVVAEGDWVAAVLTFQGTFTEAADFFGMPLSPTGEEIVWHLGVLERYNADGIIVEEWTETDNMPLLMGLGVIPPM